MANVVLNNEVTTVNGDVSQLNISSEGILTLNDDTQNWINTATFDEFLDADDTKYVLVKFKLSPDTASSSTQAAMKWECNTPPSTNIVPLIGYDPTQNKYYLNNRTSLRRAGASDYNVTLTTTEWVYVRATKTGTTSYKLTLEQPLNTQLATVTSGPKLYSYFRFVGQNDPMVCEVDLLGSGLYNSDGTIATPLATLEEATPHIEINSTIPTAMYMGTTQVNRVYFGDVLVFGEEPTPISGGITINDDGLGITILQGTQIYPAYTLPSNFSIPNIQEDYSSEYLYTSGVTRTEAMTGELYHGSPTTGVLVNYNGHHYTSVAAPYQNAIATYTTTKSGWQTIVIEDIPYGVLTEGNYHFVLGAFNIPVVSGSKGNECGLNVEIKQSSAGTTQSTVNSFYLLDGDLNVLESYTNIDITSGRRYFYFDVDSSTPQPIYLLADVTYADTDLDAIIKGEVSKVVSYYDTTLYIIGSAFDYGEGVQVNISSQTEGSYKGDYDLGTFKVASDGQVYDLTT